MQGGWANVASDWSAKRAVICSFATAGSVICDLLKSNLSA
jgi:hypothetical protein